VKKVALVGLKALVVVVIYAAIFRRVSLAKIEHLLTAGFCIALFASVVLNIAQAAVCTVRWRALARGVAHVPGFGPSFSAYLEGLFFNQALPSFIGGDAVRVLRWRAFGVATQDAVLSVIRDRLFGAIGAAALALIACVMLLGMPLEEYKTTTAFLLSGGAMAGGIGVMWIMQSRWPARFFAKFPRVHASIEHMSESPMDLRHWMWMCANAVFGQLLSGVSVYLLARSIGIELPAFFLVAFTGIILVVSMIPISLAGWGVREASFLAVLVPLGVPDENAVVLSIAFGLAGLFGALPGGICLLAGLSSPPDEAAGDLANRSAPTLPRKRN
jgi:glycosyltransferase 2 family protein